MMKTIILTILFTLASVQFSCCYAEVFQVSATIPLIPGVNFFPQAADIAPVSTLTQKSKDITRETIVKDGQKIVLQTSMVK